MITNKDIYRCYSVNLMKFLAKNDIRYILVARDIKTNKVFYAFEKTNKLRETICRWEQNSPKSKI